MRAPDDLDAVEWAALTHAYGSAGDVPALVQALYDPDAVGDALYDLYGNVWHQGSVYPATVEVVPFLAHAAVYGADRAGVLQLLADIADQPAGDLAIPVVAAVAEAVAAAAVELLPAARHPEAGVRAAYARLAEAIRLPLPEAVVAELIAVEAGDPDEDVRAEALAALAVHHRDPAPRERARLVDGNRAVRLTAAVLTLCRAGTPYPPPAVAVVTADGDRPRGERQANRITELLTADPDTGFAVAASWIDAGDHDGSGAALAARLHRSWRDRDRETTDLLTRALAHQDGPDRLRVRLVDLGLAAARLPSLPDDTHRALTAAAGHADPRVARQALLVLARSGALPPDAGPLPVGVLAVLPVKDHAVEAIRAALPTVEGNEAIALVGGLDPAVGAHLLPELVALAARGTAAVVVVRLLGAIPAAAGDPRVTATLETAMRARDEMQRAAAAASWLVLGHPPAAALDVLAEVVTTGRMPAWYLTEVARAAGRAAPLSGLVRPLLDSADAWVRVNAAIADASITGDAATATPILAEALGPPGRPALPFHVVAVEALAGFPATPAAAADRLREFRDSGRRLIATHAWPVDIPHPDERLRDAARQVLRRTAVTEV